MRTKILCPFFVLIILCANVHAQFRDNGTDYQPLLTLTSSDDPNSKPQIGVRFENLFRNNKFMQILNSESESFRTEPIFPASFWNISLRKLDLIAENKNKKASGIYFSQHLRKDTQNRRFFNDGKPDVSMNHFKSLNLGLKRSVFRTWRYYSTSMWRLRMDRAPEGKKILKEIKMDRAVR